MKKIFFKFIIIVILSALLSTCNDEIFFDIANEVPPVPPFISGSPTNFVVYDNFIYVASAERLYRYDDNGGTEDRWVKTKGPGDYVFQLAASDSYLYALCINLENSTSVLKRIADFENDEWEVIDNDNNNIQSISIVSTDIFICARNNNNTDTYKILYATDDTLSASSSSFTEIESAKETSFLRGVLSTTDGYFLCASGAKRVNGEIDTVGDIYFGKTLNQIDLIPWTCSSSKCKSKTNNTGEKCTACEQPYSKKNFMGIIEVGNTTKKIYAIARDGVLYEVTSTGVDSVKHIDTDTDTETETKKETEIRLRSNSRNFSATGVMTAWTDGTIKLLLVGRMDMRYSMDTGFTYGYMELLYNDSGEIDEPAFRSPGRNIDPNQNSTVPNSGKYMNTIGTNPINDMIHIPGSTDNILFASTHKNGVWKLFDNSWNADDNLYIYK